MTFLKSVSDFGEYIGSNFEATFGSALIAGGIASICYKQYIIGSGLVIGGAGIVAKGYKNFKKGVHSDNIFPEDTDF